MFLKTNKEKKRFIMSDGSFIAIGLIIGVIAYIFLYLGKGLQKLGIEGLKEDKTVKSKNSGVWIIGTILTTIYMFVQWVALLFAPINLIAPLEGVGLVVLLIFSYYVLKEKIARIEIIGVILILLGTVFITLFNINTGTINTDDVNLGTFLLFLIPIIIVESIAIVGSHFNDYKFAGLILGFSAGTFMAFQTVSKRITAVPDPTLTTIFTFMSLIMAGLTLGVTQYGLAKAKANIVVPCFTSASITIAIISGIVALNEAIVPMQIVGIVAIVLGIIFLTAFKEEEITD